jgi:cell division protease FtsH
MVTRWGLSQELGAIAYGENQDEVFLGHSVARTHNISDADARMITAEIRKLVDGALAQARAILDAHRAELETVALGLLRYESLSGGEIADLIMGKEPERKVDVATAIVAEDAPTLPRRNTDPRATATALSLPEG